MAAAAYVMNVYNNTKRNTGGLWRDKAGQGGIDMSPVVLLLAVGAVVMAFSFIMILGSWVPRVSHTYKITSCMMYVGTAHLTGLSRSTTSTTSLT